MARRSEGLSDRHRKIMQFLEKFQEENGYSPSIREIGDYIGVKSTSLVDYYLNQLEDRGHISRDMRVSRSIRVLKGLQPAANAVTRAVRAATEVFSVPLVGRIVASSPIPMPPSDLSYFDPDSSIEIAVSMLPGRERKEDLFALEVQGDSMIDAMVNDGDIVVMRKAQEASNGEMVAVWLDDRDETTLKYFYKENNRIRLQPANPTMKPIYVDNPKSLRIMGKVVMVIRQMQPSGSVL
ncbi:MAG TPA: transcriptional repressor LexA [Chloroflexi bacterium]|jgi:repressor LexA|nr:transcriptional repressor LexA [Chloroflexota bacterium]HPO57573.1 transcriptional repressor LexA [Anaerolineaceae bacterium]